MLKRILLILMILPAVGIAKDLSEKILLTESTIGGLPLSTTTQVSLADLQAQFSGYQVIEGFGQGDSPDFHYFEVLDSSQELVLRMYGFGFSATNAQPQYPIDLLVVFSPRVIDQFGVSLGMTYHEVTQLRNGPFEFGANHFDNFLGAGKIWYGFDLNSTENVPLNPEDFTVSDLRKNNPRVAAISWPSPRW